MSTAAFVSFTPTKTYNKFSALPFPFYTVSVLSPSGDQTLTAAQILGGMLLIDPNGSQAYTLPTAALLVAACSEGLSVGNGFEFTITNTADAGETITVTAGTGCTTSGTMTIAQSNTKRFLVVFTNITAGSEAFTIYSLGTVTT